jgi:hypothetical protein
VLVVVVVVVVTSVTASETSVSTNKEPAAAAAAVAGAVKGMFPAPVTTSTVFNSCCSVTATSAVVVCVAAALNPSPDALTAVCRIAICSKAISS